MSKPEGKFKKYKVQEGQLIVTEEKVVSVESEVKEYKKILNEELRQIVMQVKGLKARAEEINEIMSQL